MQDPETLLHIDASRDGVVATVTVTGDLDITTASTFCRHVLNVAATHPDRIVLDLDGLVFVDVAGARALDYVCYLLQGDCPVIVRNPRPSVRRVFNLTGLVDGQVECGETQVTDPDPPGPGTVRCSALEVGTVPGSGHAPPVGGGRRSGCG